MIRAIGPAGERLFYEERRPATDGGWREVRLDAAYPALGARIHSELAVALGAAAGDGGCLVVDDHARTNIPGLYAAGDVVLGLDQISGAMSPAAPAATTIRYDLATQIERVR